MMIVITTKPEAISEDKTKEKVRNKTHSAGSSLKEIAVWINPLSTAVLPGTREDSSDIWRKLCYNNKERKMVKQ